ncbi:nicotinate-nucleotide--dimethylbenzimidazole phosphoribosyltransferase [Tumebacillus permanentifrigoris]|uniref:Nicotinate-nucleotide--dimethylbenzimidazole phosphoribosyltransferase n=1 Tax=Tumebacillus permanentifrigoris TaxID=378543 RepID=A0A316DB74_9BACL|nr:nicotinate-nucleotide--dimethylbenzimidazole phosphoribosyltransferase [Tumebacillus permanentifrigoris]PWK14836.1 nicotinate-nucleotide-dimethylbenzimidazole phosphoribosyltransferase [Tumebacillus permanentifrigoris]
MLNLKLGVGVRELDAQVMEDARARWDQLTKPLGSLGKLEEIGIRLAGIQGKVFPEVTKRAVVVMCGDHGVVAEGVSAYPSAVTGLMMANFSSGRAAVNVLARQMGADVHVVDVGSCCEQEIDGIVSAKVKAGTDNMAVGPAMSREEALAAIEVGITIAKRLQRDGVQVVALGEMGIGNTTPSSAIAAVLTGHPLLELIGRGTGIETSVLPHKGAVIQRALEVNQPNPADALDVLAKVGGLEIAGLVGVVLGAASAGIAVLVDGVIAGAAALVAHRLEEKVGAYLFASHLSQEPAHRVILDAIGLSPLLQLEMRLGEGTGAVLAMPLLESATRLVREMATFADIGL